MLPLLSRHDACYTAKSMTKIYPLIVKFNRWQVSLVTQARVADRGGCRELSTVEDDAISTRHISAMPVSSGLGNGGIRQRLCPHESPRAFELADTSSST